MSRLIEQAPAHRIGVTANVALKAGTVTAWGAIGTALGQLVAWGVPSLRPNAVAISTTLSALFAALAGIGILGTVKRSPLKDLATDLREADRLFIKGLIDEHEYRALRASVIRKHSGG
jgi:hypothetical protein